MNQPKRNEYFFGIEDTVAKFDWPGYTQALEGYISYLQSKCDEAGVVWVPKPEIELHDLVIYNGPPDTSAPPIHSKCYVIEIYEDDGKVLLANDLDTQSEGYDDWLVKWDHIKPFSV